MSSTQRANMELDFSIEEINAFEKIILMKYHGITINPELSFYDNLKLKYNSGYFSPKDLVLYSLGDDWCGEFINIENMSQNTEETLFLVHFSDFLEKTLSNLFRDELNELNDGSMLVL